VLGRGSYGTAVLLKCAESGDCVVSKQIYSQFLEESMLETVETEVAISSSLSHPNIIQYLCAYHRQEQPAALCIITAYADGGTLEQAIARVDDPSKDATGRFPQEQVLVWVAQLASALAHMHERRILHRDLKAANVFLSGASRDTRLGDFGLSRSFGSQSKALASTVCGTPYYLSPELVRGEQYSTPADLWALGVVLFEILTLRRPFDAPNLAALALRISNAKCLDDGQLAQAAGQYPTELRALVGRNRHLFALDARRRMRMDALVIHLQGLCRDLRVEPLLVAAEASAKAIDVKWASGVYDFSSSAVLAGLQEAALGEGGSSNCCSSNCSGQSLLAAAQLAAIPAEVPELPGSFVPRPEFMALLKESVMSRSTGVTMTAAAQRLRSLAAEHTTIALGMGGTGKTLMAAALCHDTEVGCIFEFICWVSLGQKPDLLHLQNALHRQLTRAYLPESATDPTLALEALIEAAAGKRLLCILDDVWDVSHAKLLSCIDASTGSSLVITTRIRALVPGAAEVHCEVLSLAEALVLLLTEGGVPHLIDSPPPAALRAVELCGRLPLALGIAGGIIGELADSWKEDLIPLLEEEMGDGSVEERVVTASLRAMPAEMLEGVERLFVLFAVFPEDTAVPVAAIDVVAPLLGAKSNKRHVRRWLQQLLKGNLFRGSIEHGVSVHDLVRDCSSRRAEAAREGGLCATQREIVPLLLAAAGGTAKSYVSASLHWHVRQAQQKGTPVHADKLLMQVVCHEDESIRAQAARGLNGTLIESASACLAAGLWLEAAQLLWAAAAKRAGAAGSELVQAYEALERLEAETPASRRLELRVLTTLSVTSGGGDYAKGTKEYSAAMDRLAQLSRTSSDDAYSGAFGAATAHFMGSSGFYALEGGTGKPEYVHTTVALLEQAHDQVLKFQAALGEVASGEAKPGHWMTAASYSMFAVLLSRQHRLARFSWEQLPPREALIDAVNSKGDAASTRALAKTIGPKVDFTLFIPQAMALLLRDGDLATVKSVCLPQLLAGWQDVAEAVKGGHASWPSYFHETVFLRLFGLAIPMLLNDYDMLTRLEEHTLHGIVMRDAEAMAIFKKMHADSRPPDAEGFCMYTPDTHLLHVRCLHAVVEEDTESSRAALRQWLPPLAKLLHIARHERYWDIHMTGPTHPALLAATLHGTRLGDWETAAACARGLLNISLDVPMHPLLRIEALRLLSRATNDVGAAWSALEQAMVEAKEVGYVWMEVLALRDMLGLQGLAAEQRDAAQQRFDETTGRICASQAEVWAAVGALGDSAARRTNKLITTMAASRQAR